MDRLPLCVVVSYFDPTLLYVPVNVALVAVTNYVN